MCAFWLSCRINEEFRDVKLSDLRILATLGVGGFGRVELVQIAGDPTRSFALKQMKKSQVQHMQIVVSVSDLASSWVFGAVASYRVPLTILFNNLTVSFHNVSNSPFTIQSRGRLDGSGPTLDNTHSLWVQVWFKWSVNHCVKHFWLSWCILVLLLLLLCSPLLHSSSSFFLSPSSSFLLLILCVICFHYIFVLQPPSLSVLLRFLILFSGLPHSSFLLCDLFPNLMFLSLSQSTSWIFSYQFHVKNLPWDSMFFFIMFYVVPYSAFY